MESTEPRWVALVAMARNETLLVARLVTKLGVALLVVEVVTWIFAGAPAPQPPAALGVVEKTPVNLLSSHAAQAPSGVGTSAAR